LGFWRERTISRYTVKKTWPIAGKDGLQSDLESKTFDSSAHVNVFLTGMIVPHQDNHCETGPKRNYGKMALVVLTKLHQHKKLASSLSFHGHLME